MIRIFLAFVFMFSAGSAVANDIKCELHIWPTNNFSSGSVGTVANSREVTAAPGGASRVIVGAVSGATDKYVNFISTALSPENQVALIKKLDMPDLMGIDKNTKLYYHELSDRGFEESSKSTDSKSSCYYEIKVDHVIFNRHPIYGKDILSFFTFRFFDPNSAKFKAKTHRVRRKTGKFSIDEDQDNAEALERINQSFLEGLMEASNRFKKS